MSSLFLCADFDSIPSDLGVYYGVMQMREKHNAACSSVKSFFNMDGGGVSGGTFATMMTLASQPLSSIRDFSDPFLLNPEPSRSNLKSKKRAVDRDQMLPSYDKDIKQWTAPFVMAGCNTRVVRRTAAIMEEDGKPYGPNFSYQESMQTPNWFVAFGISIGIVIVLVMAYFSLTRKLLRMFVPAQGDGPSAEKRKASRFQVTIIAKSDATGKDQKTIKAYLRGSDGYDETARFAGESALLLALEKNKLKHKGGVLTPISAFGPHLLPRVNKGTLSVTLAED